MSGLSAASCLSWSVSFMVIVLDDVVLERHHFIFTESFNDVDGAGLAAGADDGEVSVLDVDHRGQHLTFVFQHGPDIKNEFDGEG